LEYAVEKYMLSVRSGEEAAVGEENPHHMFIVRHNNEVKRHVIENTEQLILSSLFAGGAVGVVLEEIAEKYPERLPEIEQKLQFWFSKWIENGFFCAA
jgi:hypothetical protein